MLNNLETLCALPGVSGSEDAVRDFLRQAAEPFADELLVDGMGNLLVHKKGARPAAQTVVLAAHMDEVGVIVKSVTDEGFAHFAFVGGVDRRIAIGKRVLLGDAKIPAVIGLRPIHLTTASERQTVPKQEELYLDLGAESKEDALAQIGPGTIGVFESSWTPLANDFVRAKALDDRVGCAVLLSLLQEKLPFDVWFAFHTQEEVGCRGAFGAAFRLRPDIAVVVEGTTAADTAASGARAVCAPGKGPVVPFQDGGTVYDRALVRLLGELADENQIPWQTKTRIAGGTDAQVIQRSRNGVRVAAVSAAVRYLHSPYSVGCTRDFKQMKPLLLLFLQRLEEKNG